MASPRSGSVVKAALVMVVLAFALFWLPVVGPLIAGFVGGRIAGSGGKALGIAVLPAILLAVLIGLLLAVFDLGILGFIAGLGTFVVVLVQDIPLLIGAFFGGAMAQGARR